MLTTALPRPHRAARRGGAIIMGLATNDDGGPAGVSADLQHLMLGGGSMRAETASRMLQDAGFTDVKALNFNDTTVMVAIRSRLHDPAS